MMKVILLSSFFCFFSGIDAARILGIFTSPCRSPFTCNHAIMKTLYDAGHHITMVTPFPAEEKLENFIYVDSLFESVILVGNSTIRELTDMGFGDMMEYFTDVDIRDCYNVMKLKKIQEALNSPEKLYDIMFVEVFMGHECYLAIAEKLGIPVIGTVTFHTFKSADSGVGIPNSPALIPLAVGSIALEMDLFERMKNLWNNFVFDYYHKINVPKKLKSLYREHYGGDDARKKDLSLIFYNNHPTFLSRPMTPNAIEVGGIHLKPANPLPQILQKFIDEANHGVVLFTFGSVVKASSLLLNQREAFLAAFSKIPQRVIWKYEEPIENLPKNVMLFKWLPQRDILEHKKVIAFMSHCGLGGTFEAIATETPVIAIPLFADQPTIAINLRRLEVAVSLDLETVTEAKVLDALNTIINDTGYAQRMKELSRVFKDRPMSPQESIVYWTEYVIRHNGAEYLKALGTDMPLYKYLMLDIAALVFTVTFLVIYVIYKTVKNFYDIFLSPPTFAVSEKKFE